MNTADYCDASGMGRGDVVDPCFVCRQPGEPILFNAHGDGAKEVGMIRLCPTHSDGVHDAIARYLMVNRRRWERTHPTARGANK
jgi:hypothetical protein